jgi:hypothetical protein
MSERPQQTINFTGAGNNVQFGDNNTQNIQQSFGQSVTPEAIVDEIAEAVPEDVRAEIVEPIRAEIKALAAIPIADMPKERVAERAATLAEKLLPYAPAICKRVAVFTEAALATIAPPVGWLISGVLATVRSMNAGGKGET